MTASALIIHRLTNPGPVLLVLYGVLTIALMMIFLQSDLLYNAFVANKMAWGHLNVYAYFSDIGGVKFLNAAMPPLYYIVTACYLKVLMLLNLDPASHHPKNVYVIVFRARGGLLFSLGMLLLKLPNLAMVILGVVLARKLAAAEGLDRGLTVLLWAGSPALIVTALMQGQNDVFPAVITLAALVAYRTKGPTWVLLLIGLAACFKTYALIIVPVTALALSNRTPLQAIRLAFLGVLPFLAVSLPFIGPGYVHQLFEGHDGSTLLAASYPGRLPTHLWPLLYIAILMLAWNRSNRRVEVGDVAALWFLALASIVVVNWWLPQWFLWLVPMVMIFAGRDRVFAWLWLAVNGLILLNDLFSFPGNMDGGMLMPIFGEHHHRFVVHLYRYHLLILDKIIPFAVRDGVYMAIGAVCLALCIRVIQLLHSRAETGSFLPAALKLPSPALASLLAPILLVPYMATMVVQRLAG